MSIKISSPWLLHFGIISILIMHLSSSIIAQSRQSRDGGEKVTSVSRREGTITGRVIADDGRPLADAEIIASPIEGYILGSITTTEANDEGYFKLMGMKLNAYKIDASLPGYVSMGNSSGDQFIRAGEKVTIRMTKCGVITGRVTDPRGEPLVNASVDFYMVRNLEGRDPYLSPSFRVNIKQVLTDDRGVYRAYDLLPGVYVIRVEDIPIPRVNAGSIPHDSPTYYPSVKRDAAAEVTVKSGEEVTGVNIRHRSDRGYSVSGVVSGSREPVSFFLPMEFVALINESNREFETATALYGSQSFNFYGVPDGEYELIVNSSISNFAPLHITVKGADVNGLNLRPIRTGSISGRVVVEGSLEKSSVKEIFLRVRRADAIDDNEVNPNPIVPVNENGDFSQHLADGVYRIIPDLPGDDWYVRSITRKGMQNTAVDAARDGLTIRSEKNLTGIEVKVVEGAAGLRGRIVLEGEKMERSRWRVYMCPAEEAAAKDFLRYTEIDAQSDSSFELKHIAPGKYYLIARKILDKDHIRSQSLPVTWDNLRREKLLSESKALKQEIELKPHQQITDYLLRASMNK